MEIQSSFLYNNLEFIKHKISVSFEYHLIYEFKTLRLTELSGNNNCIFKF